MSESETWRKRLKRMRTLAPLRSGARYRDFATAVARLDPLGLAAAVENPDHSQEARAAAAARLAGEAVWRIGVPGWIAAKDLDRGLRLFFGWGRRIRFWSGLGVFLSFLAIAICVGVSESAKEEAFALATERGITLPDEESREEFWDHPDYVAFRAALGDPPAARRSALAQSIGMGFAGAFMLSGLLWLGASSFRRKPARLLLLRKFNVERVGKGVSRVISNELRPFGHVVGLSDKHVRRERFGFVPTLLLAPANPLAAVLLIVFTPIRLVWRLFDRSRMGPAYVGNARDYRNLARRLRDRIGLNLQVATTSKESVLIRTNDAWWQAVIRLLMESADAIVIDLSQVSSGTAWELETLAALSMFDRCVFTAEAKTAAAAHHALKARGIQASIHLYEISGEMQDRRTFRDALLQAICARHGLQKAPDGL